MNRKIKEIYDLLYSDIVTPYNLLDNLFLDEYESVNYFKEDSKVVCRLMHKKDGVEDVFYYYFDEENKLETIINEIDGRRDIMFNREKELSTAVNGYNKFKNVDIDVAI